MEPIDLNTEILKSIRDEIRDLKQITNERFESLERTTNERFERLDQRFEKMEQRQTALDLRLTTEIMAVVGAVNEVRDLLKENLEVRNQVREHERRITSIEQRLGS